MTEVGSRTERTRPRLIHVTTTDMSLEWLLGPQLEAFQRAGFEVVGASAPGPFVERLEARGIRHLPLHHATRAMDLAEDVKAMYELRELFVRERPAVVHTHNPKPGVYGRLAARSAGVPVVVNTVHGLYALPGDPLARRAVVYGLERVAAACSDQELLQNVEDLDVLLHLGIPRQRITVLGNGVDLARFDGVRGGRRGDGRSGRDRLRRAWGIGPDEVVIGAVGRLVREKGYPELIAAFTRVRVDHPGARLVVVGPEDPDKADGLGAPERAEAEAAGVVFVGARDDMPDVYRAFDIYALASHREGFPRSAMEAAAMGLPVLATDIRGCRQVVDHGRTGLLVPLGDHDRLASGLGVLVGDEARRARMGAAGRAKAVSEFDQQAVIDRTLAVYDRLLSAVDR